MIRNKNGYSLITVLMAAAIGLVSVLAILGIVIYALRSQSASKRSSDLESLISSIFQATTSPAACSQTFFRDDAGAAVVRSVPTSSAPFAITSIKSPSGVKIYSLANAADSSGIVSMSVGPPKNQDAMTVINSKMVMAQLNLVMKKVSTQGDATNVDRAIPLCFTYDGATTLTGCGCSADQASSTTEWLIDQLGTCPPNQYFQGVQPDGTLICVDPPPPPEITIPPPPL